MIVSFHVKSKRMKAPDVPVKIKSPAGGSYDPLPDARLYFKD